MEMFSSSDYFISLSEEDRKGYVSKLTLEDGYTLPDPYSLNEEWKGDVELMPDISWPDVYNYLINTPSSFSKESMKAYKSLEAYNFFVSGHVQDVFYHGINETCSFCFIKSEVLPSQRQGKKSTMYGVWLAIHKKDGWVLTANCECMAGLGSACSHAAAPLFKLQTCSQMELNKKASTSKLCSWNRSRKRAEATPLKNIIFKRPKRGALPMEINPHGEGTSSSGSGEAANPFSDVEIQRYFADLKTLNPESAVITCYLLEEDYSSGTDTDVDEDDRNSLPEPLTSFFLPSAINDSEEELVTRMNHIYAFYQTTNSQLEYSNLCNITKVQSMSKTWFLHRAGRITASIAKMAFNVDEERYPKTFMNLIMQYTDSVDVPATRYGKNMEGTARKHLINHLKKHHTGFLLKETGLHVDEEKPYLGASPDGLVECSCHGKGVVEIKCPYKYRNGLDGWYRDKQFPISPNGIMRNNHRYYFQIQQQMLITGTNYCYFYIWTQGQNVSDTLILTVPRDAQFCRNLEEKLTSVFFKFILPELVTRKNDPNNDNPEKIYCHCRRPTFMPMIGCENQSCEVKWFHYSCVGITRAPRKTWYCNDCKSSLVNA